MTIGDEQTRISAAEAHIRHANSYKAFVDPAKLAELLSCYCEKPWDRLTALINAGKPAGEIRPQEELKGNLRSVWKRRNQIAHEADVNPTLAGVSLWPIDKVDTEITIKLILDIGTHLPTVFDEPLAENDGA